MVMFAMILNDSVFDPNVPGCPRIFAKTESADRVWRDAWFTPAKRPLAGICGR